MMICMLYLVAMIKNACVPSNPCIINNVEETQLSMEQDVNLSSSLINCSTSSTIFCLMAKSSSSDDHDHNNDDEELLEAL